MARINHASLRAQLHDCRAQFEAIKQHGEASADTLALINALFMLVDIVVAVFLERTTPDLGNSDEFTRRHRRRPDPPEGSGSRSRGPKARHARSVRARSPRRTPARSPGAGSADTT